MIIVKINKKLKCDAIDNEIIMADNDKLHILNDTAVVIWNILNTYNEISLNELIEIIINTYKNHDEDINLNNLINDLLIFLSSLCKEELIVYDNINI